MKKLFLCILLSPLFLSPIAQTHASLEFERSLSFSIKCENQKSIHESQIENFFVGEIIQVLETEKDELLGENTNYKVCTPFGEIIEMQAGDIFEESASKNLQVGQKIVLWKMAEGEYQFREPYRLNYVWILIGFFFLSALVVTKGRGFFALVGLFFSLGIILYFFVPLFAQEKGVFTTGIIAIFFLGAISILLAHGFRKSTYIALAGTGISLVFGIILSLFAVDFLSVFGNTSDVAMQLKNSGFIPNFDFRGILLVGILLGTLGVLDDVTAAQVVAVEELKKANPRFGFQELFSGAFSVGKEHLLSMINTLVLAYAGVSLPLLLLFNIGEIPFWVVLNSEVIAEEIIRTIVGSTSILFAIPITTALAAKIYAQEKK